MIHFKNSEHMFAMMKRHLCWLCLTWRAIKPSANSFRLRRPIKACLPSSGFLRGCQMVYFQTKNPNLGKFWRALEWKMLKYFMTIWNILRTFGIFYDHLVHFVLIWYIFSSFCIMYQ
jgi:hypothetical protein